MKGWPVKSIMRLGIRSSAIQSDVMIPRLRRGLTRLQSCWMSSGEKLFTSETLFLLHPIIYPSVPQDAKLPLSPNILILAECNRRNPPIA